jgi:hypothetical protein
MPANPDMAHDVPASVAKPRAAVRPVGKTPVAASSDVAHEASAPPVKVPAGAQPRGRQSMPMPARPDDAQETPEPAATARAVAKALADARLRRRETRSPQRSVPAVPPERRLVVVWPQADSRVKLTWPEQRVALMWPSADSVR